MAVSSASFPLFSSANYQPRTLALGHLHRHGLIHRDIKPENIMIVRRNETEEYAKLIDFGIAAVRDSRVAANAEGTKIVGTASYMAPEQLFGRASAASDTYSLGVVIFEMLTGRRPEVTAAGVAAKPRDLRNDIPEAAEALLLRAIRTSGRPPRGSSPTSSAKSRSTLSAAAECTRLAATTAGSPARHVPVVRLRAVMSARVVGRSVEPSRPFTISTSCSPAAVSASQPRAAVGGCTKPLTSRCSPRWGVHSSSRLATTSLRIT